MPLLSTLHKWIARLVEDAVRSRASDIHLEPYQDRLHLRYRIDGILYEQHQPPANLRETIVNGLKIMAQMKIDEKRVPQDGRIAFKAAGKNLDLRVSLLPTRHGESLVIRILHREPMSNGLAALGLFPDDQECLERLVGLSNGVVLITGPTGSGKTTTLYSCLQQINRSAKKIITVEDPIEYQIKGVNQVQVCPEIGLSFPVVLRSILRQSPNLIMIGEIRDQEAADVAIDAALTGHLVLSTMHTDDAVRAACRLVEMGVKPFLVASALRAVIAQRLVRRICLACRETTKEGFNSDREYSCGRGCPACRQTGYAGRIGLFELFLIDEQAGHLIQRNTGVAELRRHAMAHGLRSLRVDGLRKAAAGLTTISEVARICHEDIW